MGAKLYPAYRDSGVEWIGEIPEHWEVKRFGILANSVSSGFSKCSVEEGSYPVYGSTGVIGKTAHLDYEGQAILVARVGANCGYVNLVTGQYGVTDNTIRITLVSGSDYTFIFRLLSANDLNTLAFGTGQPLITGRQIKALQVPSPPLEEQKQIAAFLDRETSKIDTLIGKQQQLINLLKEKRGSLISTTVTKGLNPNAPMTDSGVEWIGDIPEHWEVKRLKDVAEGMKAGPFGSALTKDVYVSEGYRVYGQEQVIPNDFTVGDYYITPNKYDELSQYRVTPGDILISCVGTFGKIALVPKGIAPGIINPRLIRLRCGSSVLPEYLLDFMRSTVTFEQLSSTSRGGTMDIINIGTLSRIRLALPPKVEQLDIIEFLDRETSKIDTLVDKANQSIVLLKERRSSLISSAVTGKIDVREAA